MALVKAKIEVLDNVRGVPGTIEVQFNPTEYTLSKSAQIADIAIPGIDAPIQQFIRGQTEKLTLDLFFDTTKSGMGDRATSVETLTAPIYQLVKIQPETHALPRIRFIWGQGLSFKAICESVQRKFTLFNPGGLPLRATLSVTFREYKTLEEQIAELNLQSTDHSKRRRVEPGDTLSRIAAAEYGDPTQWREIADANAVADPLAPEPGTVLTIPAIEGAPRRAVGR